VLESDLERVKSGDVDLTLSYGDTSTKVYSSKIPSKPGFSIVCVNDGQTKQMSLREEFPS